MEINIQLVNGNWEMVDEKNLRLQDELTVKKNRNRKIKSNRGWRSYSQLPNKTGSLANCFLFSKSYNMIKFVLKADLFLDGFLDGGK